MREMPHSLWAKQKPDSNLRCQANRIAYYMSGWLNQQPCPPFSWVTTNPDRPWNRVERMSRSIHDWPSGWVRSMTRIGRSRYYIS